MYMLQCESEFGVIAITLVRLQLHQLPSVIAITLVLLQLHQPIGVIASSISIDIIDFRLKLRNVDKISISHYKLIIITYESNNVNSTELYCFDRYHICLHTYNRFCIF